MNESMTTTRRATRAGSWYSSDSRGLGNELDSWMRKAQEALGGRAGNGPVRGIIVPHAGYRYCGSCAGYAYSQIDAEVVQRVFILGPLHHARLSGCAITSCSKYATPFYELCVDTVINEELMHTRHFETISLQADEDEHSIEMHLPYIAKVMQSKRRHFTIVPIFVGSLSYDEEVKYGKLLAKYLADPSNLFVVSSDFCHWGQRFRYTYYDQSKGDIHESIKALDVQGMQIIETMDHEAFAQYLKKYGNTICGRHPIGVFLGAVQALKQKSTKGSSMSLKFLNYDQSNQCKSMMDSSVSYAASVFTLG